MKELIVTALLGMSVGHFGTTNQEADVAPPPPPVRLQTPAPTHIALASNSHALYVNELVREDVERATANFEAAFEAAPAMPREMARSVQEHGVVKSLLYTNPSLQAATDDFGHKLGAALGALSQAIVKDMLLPVQDTTQK